MRLALAAVALVVALPANAAPSGKCIARAHKEAIPYDFDERSGGMTPADTSLGTRDPGPNDAEVAGIDQDSHGQQWVYRVHEFAWKRQDVDLRGDCRREMPR